ncbi:hypothetical protein B296_00036241 [Ensete ventricosum]|uniref:Uncharacterized protein n=1 Tax=Ensete ventricosum TaxID=4639 RepID=A0A426X924_ENSVE|nr:hypothetical protein B296_00036241 [Ensete ventricosum]
MGSRVRLDATSSTPFSYSVAFYLSVFSICMCMRDAMDQPSHYCLLLLLLQRWKMTGENGDCEEAEVEKTGGRGEGELYYHIIGAMGGGAREDEIGDDDDEDA